MNTKAIQKTFIIGDKWLYYKLYCGFSTADTILLKVIKPLTDQLIEDNLIEKWFFIRYSDPEPHLRVRFLITDVNELADIILNIKEFIAPYVVSKQIWNVQVGTYQRELERYGANSIEISESFFYDDSQQIISIIHNSKNEEKRFLTVLKRVEIILKLFHFDNEIQLSFLNKMQESFKEKFKADKFMRKELGVKYRKLKPLFTENKILKDDIKTKEIINKILELEKEKLLVVSLGNLLASFIHMTINRGFSTKQRMYEMMIYDFLYRKNKSIFARYGKL